MAVIITSLIPLLGGLSRKQQHSESPVQGRSHKHLCCESPHTSTSQNPMTPKRSHRLYPSTPKCTHRAFDMSPQPTRISSPLHAIHSPQPVALVPAPGFELRVCLHDFTAADSTLPRPGYSMWNPWKGGWTAEIPGGFHGMMDGFHGMGAWIPWNGGWIPYFWWMDSMEWWMDSMDSMIQNNLGKVKTSFDVRNFEQLFLLYGQLSL